MKALINLIAISFSMFLISGCYGKFIHENDQDRQKDAGYQNFSPAVVSPTRAQLQEVSCTKHLGPFGISIREAVHTHGDPQQKASTQLKCYEDQQTKEPILQIKSQLSGDWVWFTKR